MLLFTLSILCFSNADSTLLLNQGYRYYLFLTDEGAILNKTKTTFEDFETDFTTTTISDGTIHLNLDVNFDPNNKNCQLIINTITLMPYNLDLVLHRADNSENLLYIYFADDWNTENVVNFTFKSDIDLSYKPASNIFIKGFSIDGEQQLTQILPKTQRRSCTICYYNNQCLQYYQIQPDETYITSPNSDFFDNINSVYEGLSNLKFLFTDTEPLEQKPFVNWSNFHQNVPSIELIGLIEGKTCQFDLYGVSGTFPLVVIENVQFINGKEDSTLKFSADEVFVKDTINVFPEVGDFSIKITHEYRKNSNQSPFENLRDIKTSIFDIFPDFEKNGNVQINMGSVTTIVDSMNREIATVPNLWCDEMVFKINDQKNPGNRKFTIKCVLPEDNARNTKEEAFTKYYFRFENCDHIPIELNGFNHEDLLGLIFYFYTQNKDDITISRVDSNRLGYIHYGFNNEVFDSSIVDSGNVLVCIGSDCDSIQLPNLGEEEIYKKSIIGNNLNNMINDLYDFLEGLQNLDMLTIAFNSNLDTATLDLKSHLIGSDYLSLIFYGTDRSNPIKVNLLSFPTFTDIYLWNCFLNVQTTVTIESLVLVDNSSITGDGATFEDVLFGMSVDVSNNDVTIYVDEKDFEIDGLKSPASSGLVLLITTGNSRHTLIIDTKVTNPYPNLVFQFSFPYEQNVDLPLKISDRWPNLPNGQYESIIIYIEYARIILDSIPNNVLLEETNNMNTLTRIPVNCARDKVVVCYNSNQCDKQEIKDEEFFFTLRDEKDFTHFLQLMRQNAVNQYQYFKFLLTYEKEPIQLKFQELPLDKIKQVQLIGLGTYPSISLSKDVETQNIKSLLIEKARFSLQTTDKVFNFNEIAFVNTPTPFSTSNEYNVKINIARIHCIKDYEYEGIQSIYDRIDSVVYELFTNLETTDYVIYYRKNTIYVNSQLDDYISCDISFTSVDISKSFFLVHGSSTSNKNLILAREDEEFGLANVVIDRNSAAVPINFTCVSETHSKFSLNVYVYDDRDVTIDNGNCSDIESLVIHYPFGSGESSYESIGGDCSNENNDDQTSGQDIGGQSSNGSNLDQSEDTSNKDDVGDKSQSEESKNDDVGDKSQSEESKNDDVGGISSNVETKTQSVSPSSPTSTPNDEPIVNNTESSSSSFELTDTGYISQETGENEKTEKPVNKQDSTINTITFTQPTITITEKGGFSSSNPLYFVASGSSQSIIIDKDVTKSNIGVSSQNSPTVKLQKSDNPISLMNNVSSGKIIIQSPEKDSSGQKVSQLVLRDIVNRRGDLSLVVPPHIDIATFTKLSMSHQSSVGISQSSNSRILMNKKKVKSENPVLQVKESVDISPDSEISFSNVEVAGQLNIYDDSILMLEKGCAFSTNSKVNVVIQKMKTYTIEDSPIIHYNGNLESIPSSVTLSSKEMINIVNLPIFSAETFDKCSVLVSRVSLADGKKGSITPNCTVIQKVNVLLLTVKEEANDSDGKGDGNKLSAGAIAGIVIACVVVVGLVIGLTVYFLKCRNKSDSDSAEDVSNGMEL